MRTLTIFTIIGVTLSSTAMMLGLAFYQWADKRDAVFFTIILPASITVCLPIAWLAESFRIRQDEFREELFNDVNL